MYEKVSFLNLSFMTYYQLTKAGTDFNLHNLVRLIMEH